MSENSPDRFFVSAVKLAGRAAVPGYPGEGACLPGYEACGTQPILQRITASNLPTGFAVGCGGGLLAVLVLGLGRGSGLANGPNEDLPSLYLLFLVGFPVAHRERVRNDPRAWLELGL